MTPLQRLLPMLKGVRGTANGQRVALCPAHDDHQPSLSIAEGEDCRVLLTCHAGCTVAAITASLGLALRDLMPERETGGKWNGHEAKKSARQSFATFEAAAASFLAGLNRGVGDAWVCRATYVYEKPDGSEYFRVLRFERRDGSGKSFRPLHQLGARWAVGAPEGMLCLYKLPALRGEQTVLVVEGEKCADSARELGLTATTSAHGAKAPKKSDWSVLAGRSVALIPDNDDAGRSYVREVAGLLAQLEPAPSIKLVELPGLRARGDIADFIRSRSEIGQSNEQIKDEIEALIAEAGPYDPSSGDASGKDPQPKKRIPAHEPFPVEALSPLGRELVEAAAKSIGCSTSFLALPLMAVCASLIGNTWRLELKPGWSEPAIIWVVILGESGSQKSPALDVILGPVRQMEELAAFEYEQGLQEHRLQAARYEKEFSRWRRATESSSPPPAECLPPVLVRYSCSDTTIEALAPLLAERWRGLLLMRDELSGWLLSFNQYRSGVGGDIAVWLEVFGGRSLRIDRKTGSRKSIYVPRAAVSICGGIQPGALAAAIGRARFEDGLVARVLFAYPERKVGRWTEASVSDELMRRYAAMLGHLAGLEPQTTQLGPQPRILTLSLEAKSLWIEFHDANASEQETLGGDLAAAWSKLTGYGARLALVVHMMRLAEGDPTADRGHVDAVSMRSGIALSRWFAREAERVYAMLRESEGERDLRQRAELITREFGGSVTVRDWRQRNSRRTTAECRAELDALVEGGFARWHSRPSGPQGGRPTEECRIVRPPPEPPAHEDVSSCTTPPTEPDGGEVSGFRLRGAGGGENDESPEVTSRPLPEALAEPGESSPQPETLPTPADPVEFAAPTHPATQNPETPPESEGLFDSDDEDAEWKG